METISLQGYRAVSSLAENGLGIAILIANKCAFQEHDLRLGNTKLEALLVEIIPNSWLKNSVFVINVYCSPRDNRQTFYSLTTKASSKARETPLVMAGDFNAPHEAWGYVRSIPKGCRLLQAATDSSLELITDPHYPTRMGNSVSRATTPDLAFVKNAPGAEWHNLKENLGSDHYIVEISLPVSEAPQRAFEIVDWDAFRKRRKDDHEKYESFADLVAQLKKDVAAVTRTVETDLKLDRMDARLAHLLEAKNSLTARWKTRKLNRHLRRRIAALNHEIEPHCKELGQQQWNEVCASVDGQMRAGGKWNLLKQLLDDSQSKRNHTLAINRLVHKLNSEGASMNEVMDEVARRYLPIRQTGPEDYPAYGGKADKELDAPFSVSEVRATLQGLNGRSAPGPDGISNRLLRNLDEGSIELLTKEINDVWEAGIVPDAWKEASIKSDGYALGACGTPQGAVLSPLLFNISMSDLSVRLDRLGAVNLNHAIYADDITVWCGGGSDAAVERALQEALQVAEEFLEGTGLVLSPTKSELLLKKTESMHSSFWFNLEETGAQVAVLEVDGMSVREQESALPHFVLGL
ncbi:uncharacterized protein LOC142583674 [Dermacentor variabilis]|uniref:uncharacterized protein LOC142583674 n=1 Tax=Dermacentor variabilis TaxID=34621 RepID=UPI003F5B486C